MPVVKPSRSRVPDRDHKRLQLIAADTRHAPDIAEVEDPDVLAIGQEEVPGVRVGVVEAVPEDHLEIDVRGPLDERVHVPPDRFDRGPVRERSAFQHAHRQHTRARELGIRRGDDHIRLVGEVGGEPLQVQQFLSEVDRAEHHLLELADEHRRPILRELGILLLEIARECLHQIEVVEHLAVGTRVDDLHRDLVAVVKRRAVHLRDRTRPDRVGVERREQLGDGSSEVAFDGRLRETGRVGRHARLQPTELVGDVGPHEIRPEAQHLSELHPRRAELGQHQPQAFARPELAQVRLGEVIGHPLGHRHPLDPGAARRPLGESVASEDRDDVVDPRAMAHEGPGDVTHGCLPRLARCCACTSWRDRAAITRE